MISMFAKFTEGAIKVITIIFIIITQRLKSF